MPSDLTLTAILFWTLILLSSIQASISSPLPSSSTSTPPPPFITPTLATSRPIRTSNSRTLSTTTLNKIPNQYLIIFKRAIPDLRITSHLQWLQFATHPNASTLLRKKADLSSFPTLPVFPAFRYIHRFTEDAIELKGYAAEMSQEIADQVKMLPEVELVEQDSMGTFEAVQPSPLNWGLRRISQANLPLPQNYTYPDQAGSNVDIYFIDTGIDITNPEFEGRAIWGANFAGDGIDRDLVGHGTQTAGIAGSRSHGVSKQSRLIAVKISGSLTFQVSSLISGLTWISSQIATTPTRRAVVNMSLRVGISDAVDLAVNRVMSVNGESVALVASAGNDGGDACNYSPARVPLVVTVGAVDATDAAWSGSNTGGCVDVVAPGVNITTTTLNNAVTSVTGTSFSTAHITGILALHLSIQPFPRIHAMITYLKSLTLPTSHLALVPQALNGPVATLTPPPTCTDFSVCAQGYAPDPNCGNCVAAIQSWDGWCAGNDGGYWDEGCVGYAGTVCGVTC